MEVGEGVAIVIAFMENTKDCEYEPPNTNWKANLQGDSRRLAENITKHMHVPKPATPKSAAELSSTCWPCQAHHLIPWKQLQGHAVTQWVAQKPPKVAGKVIKDTKYDVDHGANGKFMPYASDLPEWKTATAAEKDELARKVMGFAGIQLHQGRHTATKYSVGEDGYKSRVDEYLTRINKHLLNHMQVCPKCKEKTQNGRVPPLNNVVLYLDKASERIEVDINLGRIFVSRRAADYVASGGAVG
ncbi:MAG TPA: AHH domain-containing protein [Steroidobacteraceae bacterium]